MWSGCLQWCSYRAMRRKQGRQRQMMGMRRSTRRQGASSKTVCACARPRQCECRAQTGDSERGKKNRFGNVVLTVLHYEEANREAVH